MDKKNELNELMDAIIRLNGVEGFNPADFIMHLDDGKEYMQTYYRILWFHLKYPDGLIDPQIRNVSPELAVVETKIYRHYSDRAEDKYIARASALRKSGEGIAANYLEAAETASIGRALSRLAFNIASVPNDEDDGSDNQFAEAPIAPTEKTEKPAKSKRGKKKESAVKEEPEEENLEKPQEQTVAEDDDGQLEYSGLIQPDAGTPVELPESAKQEIKKQQEAAQTEFTTADASKVIIPFGSNKGRTLGELVLSGEKGIRDLEWIANAYNGPDETLRTAAKILIEAASN